MHRTLIAASAALACLVLPAGARQNPQPTTRFRSGVELVTLDVSVLDRDRVPVRGLTAADFTVLEDGRPQKIEAFTAFDVPDTAVSPETPAPWVRDVAPDVAVNTQVNNRRIVLIVMDDATPMPAPDVLRARRCARQIIEQLQPPDYAAVVYTLNKENGQEYTADRRRLLAAVDRFNGSIDNEYGLDPKQGGLKRIPFDEFNETAPTLYKAVLLTLRELADGLSALPERRKAIFFVSVGLPLDIEAAAPVLAGPLGGDKAGLARQFIAELLDVFRAARRANVNVYAIDPGGLRAPYEVASATPANPGRLNREFLQAVSENTGGLAVVNTNDQVPGIRQAFRENASYYLLGYAPQNVRQAGRYRRIEVRVNRPGLTVRTRRGYFEAKGPTDKAVVRAAGIEEALARLLPKTDLDMDLNATPVAMAGNKRAVVAIVVGMRQPALDTPAANHLDLQVAAFEPDGKLRESRRENASVSVNQPRADTFAYEVTTRLDLAPGRYYLRVAAASSSSGGSNLAPRTGSVYCDLDVPDFEHDALSLSGIVLGITPPRVASAGNDRLSPFVPFVPTNVRRFDRYDRVRAFLRIYQGGTHPLQPVVLDVRILDGRGEAVFSRTETLATERFQTGHAADYLLDLPLSDLASGPHLLTLEARAGAARARRETRFEIR